MQEEERNNNLPVASEEPKEKGGLGDAWREVGDQFQQLGSKLADTIRRSWQSSAADEESEETMRRLRDDLRAAADRVDTVIHQVKDETTEERAATMRATRRASEQSLDEARVLTASSLRRLNQQLDHLIQRLEREEEEEKAQSNSGEGSTTPENDEVRS